MTLKQQLAQITGVWEGAYTHFKPTGEKLDHHASRQETRLEGDRWYERIIYRWPDGREQVLDFRATFAGAGDAQTMVFEDPNFHGESFSVTPEIFVFPYFWKNKPELRIVETIVFSDANRRSRLWQSFEHGELVKVTVISERRVAGQPAVWY